MYVYNLCNLCNLCRVCRVCSVCIACRYVVTQCNAMCRVVLCYIVSLLSSTCNSYICPCPLLRVFERCCPGLLSFTCLAWPARQLEDEVLIGLLGAKIAAWSHWSTSEDFRPWSLFSKLLKASRFYLWLFVLMYNTRNMDLNSETWQMCSCRQALRILIFVSPIYSTVRKGTCLLSFLKGVLEHSEFHWVTDASHYALTVTV